MEDQMEQIPDGYMKDSKGRLTPVDLVKPIDKTRDDLINDVLGMWKAMLTSLIKFKTQIMGDIEAFVDLSAEQYGVHLGGKKGNISLVSFDGRKKLVVAIGESLAFDEQIHAAKALLDECAAEWTEGGPDEARAIINDAFQVDKEGNISVTRILSLRRLDIKHPKWLTAMDAIGNSIRVSGSKPYVRAYERDENDKWVGLPLDIAAL
jgi:hypothetical protein